MSLIDRLGSVGEARVWYGNMPLESEYTVGIAGERFFRTLKDEGVFVGTVCPNCDLIYVPPSIYCERCFTELEEWVEVPSKGEVYTFTILTRSLDGEPLEKPDVLALVRLEGAHGGFLHRLEEVELDDVEIGMAVEVVLKPVEQREGSLLDIKHFRPL